MKKLLFVFMFACGIFLFPGLSHAESAEAYLSGYLGVAFPHDSDAADNTGVGGSGDLGFDAGAALGTKLGYWFSAQKVPYLGLQIDFNGHFPDLDEFKIFGTSFPIDGDVTVYSLTVNALLRYPEGALRPYGGVGVGWFIADIDDVIFLGFPFAGDDDSAFGWQLLAGVELRINPEVSVFTEYKYSAADFEFGGGIGLDVDYEVSQVYGGVTLHF